MRLVELLEEDAYSTMPASKLYEVGMKWKLFGLKKFDSDRALDELIKKDKKGFDIYNSGLYWKKFNYDKGLKALNKFKNKYYYEKAIRNWPKGIKQTDTAIKKIKEKATKLKDKPLKLSKKP